jgi:hypothetical protein
MNRSICALVLACGLVLGLVSACRSGSQGSVAADGSAASGDRRAHELAEQVVESLGGWSAWNRTRYLSWRFFGGRLHVWDKQSGDWRLEEPGRVVLMNVNTRAGRAFESGAEVFDEVRRQAALERAYSIWINDSYWMFLPWKLEDPGVHLRHAGVSQLQDGSSGQMLELTFERVGLTPQNRYLVFVGDESGHIEQWSYFADAQDEQPKLVLPWRGWKRFGEITLCTDHGDLPGRSGSDWHIAVHRELPRALFEDPSPAQLP